MKRMLLPILVVNLLSMHATGQIELNEDPTKRPDTSSTQGFFMNKGATQIKSLECYDFKDMIVAFDIDESYFDYDYIQIDIDKGDPYIDKYGDVRYTQEEFRRLAAGKDYIYVTVFSKEDLKEQSRFGFDRAELEFNYHGIIPRKMEKTLNATISGWDITDTKIVYTTKSDGSVEANDVDTEESTILAKFKIDLLNGKGKFVAPLIGGFFLRRLPTTSGNCYN